MRTTEAGRLVQVALESHSNQKRAGLDSPQLTGLDLRLALVTDQPKLDCVELIRPIPASIQDVPKCACRLCVYPRLLLSQQFHALVFDSFLETIVFEVSPPKRLSVAIRFLV